MLSEEVEGIVARASLWAGSLGRRIAGVEHVAAILVPVDGNAERWAVIEQLLNELGTESGDVVEHPAESLSGDLRSILVDVEQVDPPPRQLGMLKRGVVAWVDALVVLAASPRSDPESVGDGAEDSQPYPPGHESAVEDRSEEEARLRQPSQTEAVERAWEFERWLTEIVEGDPAQASLDALGPGAPPASRGMVGAAAVELLLADRSSWTSIADQAGRSERLMAQLESLVERREVSYRRLCQLWEGLSQEQSDRFRIRLEVHLGEADLEANADELHQQLAALLERGPSVPGGWDCGRSDEQRVGVLLLLAERLARGEDVGELMWACDQVRGRFGARVGPLAIDSEGSFVASPTRAGMTVFIGPPGSGKTTCLESAILTWPGPLIATTTKRGDWRPGFVSALLDKGPVWLLDATGEMEPPHPEVQPVRWSPLQEVHDWDSARRVGYIIAYSGQRAGLTDADFWFHSAYQMVSTYLFAAQHGRRSMGEVAAWIDSAEEAEVMGCLAGAGNEAAALQFAAMMRLDPRTRDSVLATARVSTDPFRSRSVRAVTDRPTFDFKDQLIPSNGTVLVYADGFRAANTAALYALFIDAAINARKSLADSGWLGPHLMFALDEVANITPLPSLPQVLTEGPGRGITGIFCLQDLRQARARWGGDGDLFLTSSGHRVIFPGTTNSELHDFVLRHVRPNSRARRVAGFHQQLEDRQDPPNMPGVPADVASPGEASVVIINPLAQVTVAEQVRSFSAAEYVAAQYHAAVVYDERNRVVVRGVEPVRTDELGDDDSVGEPIEFDDEDASDRGFGHSFPPSMDPNQFQEDGAHMDLIHDDLEDFLGGPIGVPTMSPRPPLPPRDRLALPPLPPGVPATRLPVDEGPFDIVLDCRGRRGVSTALLRIAIRDVRPDDFDLGAVDRLIRRSRTEPVVLLRGEELDDARAVLGRLAQAAPDLAYLIGRSPAL